MFTFADKTANIYKLEKERYNKPKLNEVTKNYTKVSDNCYNSINRKSKVIAKKENVLDKMEANGKQERFIALKDHKQNFDNNQKVRKII